MISKYPRRPWRLILVLLCLGAAGCAKVVPRSAANPEQSEKVERELAAFARGREEIPALSAYMKVKSGARSRRELFDVAVLAKPPNRLYLQFLDDLGQERFRVVADGREVLFYDAPHHTYQLLPPDRSP